MRGRDLTLDGASWTYKPASHKTAHQGKRRLIPLGPKAVAVVNEFLTSRPDAYLFRPAGRCGRASRPPFGSPAVEANPLGGGEAEASPGAKHAAAISEADLPQRDRPGVRQGVPPSNAVEDPGEAVDWRPAGRAGGLADGASLASEPASPHGGDRHPD